MKQSLFFRLLVVLMFCMASLVIKSETSFCRATCFCTSDKAQKSNSAIFDEPANNINDKSEIFFIKI